VAFEISVAISGMVVASPASSISSLANRLRAGERRARRCRDVGRADGRQYGLRLDGGEDLAAG
jgi:hypothetical protein